ncbi:MAG: ECF-type sigma factor [Pirellulaceae bacterium]
MGELTRILERAESGDPVAIDELLPLVYNELRQLARSKLSRESPNQSLQTTELVHEAYLRLIGPNRTWEGRRHFFAAAAESMRRILIDRARRKHSVKHGGQFQRIELNEQSLEQESTAAEMLIVNDLFDRLTQYHPGEAEIAKLHYFAGFSIRECAKAIGIPSSTAHDRWRFARAWLVAEMQDRD